MKTLMKKPKTAIPTLPVVSPFPAMPTLPTAYEAAQLAIALRGRQAEERPFEAVRAAMEIWLTAAYELCSAKGDDFMRNACHFRAPFPEEPALDGRVLMALRNDENQKSRWSDFGMLRLFKPENLSDSENPVAAFSPAMDFVNGWCRKGPLPPFKSIHMFKKAWMKFKPDCNFEELKVHLSELQEFMKSRNNQRLSKDAERKQLKRGAAKGKKTGQTNPPKIVAGQAAVARRKKN